MSIEHGTATSDWHKIPTARGEHLEVKDGAENGCYELWQANVGDVIHVVAGEGEQQYIYDFEVKSAHTEPTVVVKQTGPDGSVVFFGDFEVTLRGSGAWVGPEWPLYKYGRGRAGDHKQILINYGSLATGGDIVLFDPDPERPLAERMVTLQPAISSIDIITLK
jgi:hypothetical protein